MALAASESVPVQLPPTIIVQHQSGGWAKWLTRALLALSLLLNFALLSTVGSSLGNSRGPTEVFESGDRTSSDKLALLEVNGTIMPPFTERTLQTIDRIADDDDVKGVVLVIDSPGGLVADSHQIYHRLKQLSQKKPVYVSMARLAASGGYYIAMGAGPEGKIFAEPTTWTGSIGVIMPRYELSGLGEKIGVASNPLTKGALKDTLNPFKELTQLERKVWDDILEDAYQRFQGVIVENRSKLDAEQVQAYATGQVFTTDQAIAAGLVDEVAFRQDVIDKLAAELGLSNPQVVRYQHPFSVMDLLRMSASSQQSSSHWQSLLDASVPQAMYFCGWTPGLTAPAPPNAPLSGAVVARPVRPDFSSGRRTDVPQPQKLYSGLSRLKSASESPMLVRIFE